MQLDGTIHDLLFKKFLATTGAFSQAFEQYHTIS